MSSPVYYKTVVVSDCWLLYSIPASLTFRLFNQTLGTLGQTDRQTEWLTKAKAKTRTVRRNQDDNRESESERNNQSHLILAQLRSLRLKVMIQHRSRLATITVSKRAREGTWLGNINYLQQNNISIISSFQPRNFDPHQLRRLHLSFLIIDLLTAELYKIFLIKSWLNKAYEARAEVKICDLSSQYSTSLPSTTQ